MATILQELARTLQALACMILTSLAAMQDINLACKNLTRVLQDFYRNLARCKRESCMPTIYTARVHIHCCYGNQLLHPCLSAYNYYSTQ